MVTFGLLSQRGSGGALAAVASGLLYWNATPEELECSERWGPEYEAYMTQMPRFNLLLGVLRRLRRGA